MSESTNTDLFSDERMYSAYRKAKADLFFERSIPNAKKFARYEDDLQGNLKRLQQRLTKVGKKPWFEDLTFIGNVTFIPQKLTLPEENRHEPAFFASNAIDTWNRIFERDSGLKAEFRPMADFTVDMHVVCAIWIDHVGEKLDACLDDSALGARLRRISTTNEYHRTVWQSFQPYFQSYKQWRDAGFAAIRREVNDGRRVVALTMDFRRFFHKIDPRFLLEEQFNALIPKPNGTDGPFSEEQLRFSERLVTAFETWGKAVPGYVKKAPVGVPVGATASRVIANVLLLEFDRAIRRHLLPVYYARYVDDVFLVLPDNGAFRSGGDVVQWLTERMGGLIETNDGLLKVKLPYAKKSEIEFQTDKQRVFLIDNTDLLDAIKSKVDAVSSEWRLLPDLDQMEHSAAGRVLTTSVDGTSEGDALRKTDTLLLKRLGFAILLRNADSLASLLPTREWKRQRHELYEFSLRHVVAPGKLFELSDYLPRLISLAVCCRDWTYAKRLVTAVYEVFDQIRQRAVLKYLDVVQLGESAERIWTGFRSHLQLAFEEAFLKSLTPTKSAKTLRRAKDLHKVICRVPLEFEDFFADETELAEKLFCRDLARLPFKSRLLKECRRSHERSSPLPEELPELFSQRNEEIQQLYAKVGHAGAPTMPILFPTRPLSFQDIAILWPNVATNIDCVKATLNTIRGTHYKHRDRQDSNSPKVIRVGYGGWGLTPRIAVTSFRTEPESWCAAAGRKPDFSAARFERLAELCNAILKSPRDVRPTHVLFPELSIPNRWMRTIAEVMLRSGISLIAGEEYSHHGTKQKPLVDSPARLFLTDNRLGYPAWSSFTQLKGMAAHHERDELRQKFGISLTPSNPDLATKFIFNHLGFRFGILICSELTDMRYRLKFRGKIDALFVLSWNQDLESFAALVDAAALDIHCYVALVNNRMFGDSRIRVPHKNSWNRDAVRVKGGLSDYFVVAELDIASLRDFQSHQEPPSGPFKPFPEGFKISKARKVVPGANRKTQRHSRGNDDHPFDE